MILNARDGKSLPVYGDGKNIRDWLYVEDYCEAIWEIIKKRQRGVTYNVGGQNELENIVVVQKIADLLDEMVGSKEGGSRRELITMVPDRPGHDRRYAIDCSKIGQELGWSPKESFETGLRKTVQWYLDSEQWVERALSKFNGTF